MSNLVTMTITHDPATGLTNVTFPQVKAICIYMLHEAENVIDEHFRPKILQPHANGGIRP